MNCYWHFELLLLAQFLPLKVPIAVSSHVESPWTMVLVNVLKDLLKCSAGD